MQRSLQGALAHPLGDKPPPAASSYGLQVKEACMTDTKRGWILTGMSLNYCASLDASCEIVMKCLHLCTSCILCSRLHRLPDVISAFKIGLTTHLG